MRFPSTRSGSSWHCARPRTSGCSRTCRGFAARLTGAVEEYARGIHVDLDRITEAASDIDPTNPEGLQEIMSSGVFEPQDTPAQEAAKVRLDTLLALVEGWVAAVVDEASSDRLPAATRWPRPCADGGPRADLRRRRSRP